MIKRTSVLFALVAIAGLYFVSSGGVQVLSTAEVETVLGGDFNCVKYTFTNCPASSAQCTQGLCNQTTQVCPTSAEYTKNYNTYPSGETSGATYEGTMSVNYACRSYRYCSNPCIQNTGDNLWYCSPASGNPTEAFVDAGVVSTGTCDVEA